jgi:hypothetical protein
VSFVFLRVLRVEIERLRRTPTRRGERTVIGEGFALSGPVR